MPIGIVMHAIQSGTAPHLSALPEAKAGTPVRTLLAPVAMAVLLALMPAPSGLAPHTWSTAAHAEDVVPPAPAGARILADTPFQLVLPQGHLFGAWGGTR